ncbi:MAG: hypothetical protein ACRYG7_04635 [Janthinobacterium lividum]
MERLLLHEGLSDTSASFQDPTEALAFLLQQLPVGLVPQLGWSSPRPSCAGESS